MAHNSKVWPGGLVDGVTTVGETEFEALDANGASAVNGDDGGSWSPSNPIVIGGSGLQISTLIIGSRIKSTNYIVDADGPDTAILVDSSGGVVSITLPAPTDGRVLIVSDYKQRAATHNITIARAAIGDTIDGLAADFVMKGANTSVILLGFTAGGGGWKSLGKV